MRSPAFAQPIPNAGLRLTQNQQRRKAIRPPKRRERVEGHQSRKTGRRAGGAPERRKNITGVLSAERHARLERQRDPRCRRASGRTRDVRRRRSDPRRERRQCRAGASRHDAAGRPPGDSSIWAGIETARLRLDPCCADSAGCPARVAGPNASVGRADVEHPAKHSARAGSARRSMRSSEAHRALARSCADG